MDSSERTGTMCTGLERHHHAKRNFAPKVRTGCLLCKARKVKCDEGKPSCQRCLNRRQTCAYIIPRAKIFDPKARLTSLSSSSSPPPPPQIIPLSVRYGNWQETSALAFYVKRTGPMLSFSSCAKDFWTVFVPQASWKFPAVKSMLVALSLLDQHLSSPMWTLVPDAEYFLALKSYNRAIGELTGTKPSPSSTAVLLTSVLAWMFEGISNRPDVANLHIDAALKIAAELRAGDQRGLSVEESEIVQTIEQASLGDSYTFLEMWAPSEGRDDPEAFETLYDARRGLAAVIETIKSSRPLRTDLALRDLRSWRLSFEAYRYKGIEPLAQKRQVFLHHNIVITCIALQHFSSLTPDKYRQILADTEALMLTEDVCEIREGLLLVLSFLLEHGCSDEGAHAERIKKEIERL